MDGRRTIARLLALIGVTFISTAFIDDLNTAVIVTAFVWGVMALYWSFRFVCESVRDSLWKNGG
jgi:hypothetical protein